MNNKDGVEIECHIFDTKLFIQLVLKHNAVVTQNVYITDPNFVWFEDESIKQFRTYWFRVMNLQNRKIRSSLIREAEIWCFAKAKRLWHEGDRQKSRKNIVHAIRYLLFAHQLVTYGSITDYTVGNQWYKEMFDPNNLLDTWTEYETKYKPLLNKLRDDLSDYVKKQEKQYTEETLYEYGHFKVIPFIQKYGLEYLSRIFCVHITPIDDQTIKLTRDVEMDRYDSSIVRECNGMIVDTQGKLKCLPFTKFLSYDQQGADILDLSSTRITILERGIGYTIWFDNEWKVTHDTEEKEWLASLCNETTPRNTFWQTWNEQQMEIPTDQNYCFMFVMKQCGQLVHVGSRDMHTQMESDLTYPSWTPVQTYDHTFGNEKDEMKKLQMSLSLDMSTCKGVVCYDMYYHRVRVYLPVYALLKNLSVWGVCVADGGRAYQNLSSAHNDQMILSVLRLYTLEQQEQIEKLVLEINPLFIDLYHRIRDYFNEICRVTDTWWDKHVKGIKWNDQKEFAQYVKGHYPLDSVIIFAMKRKHIETCRDLLKLEKGIDLKVLLGLWEKNKNKNIDSE
jgi:hypothetical protein